VRRLCLAVLVAAAALPAAGAGAAPTAACRPTPIDAGGPFGQGTPPRRAKIGTGHVLTGVVLGAPSCRPLKGVQVELMQAGRDGYTPKGTATVVTNAQGRFRFEGPRPVDEGFGGPHIHIRVSVGGFKTLVTRYVLQAGETRGSVRLVLEPDDV
jgi:protocatechuate 3,4-dioxygenase beta subunit